MSSRSSSLAELPKPSSILISNAKAVLGEDGPLFGKSILVKERRISAIGERSDILKREPVEVELDGSKCIAMPGFVNNHCHMAMSLLRGYAEDLPLLSWLKERVWPAEAKLTGSDFYLGALVSGVESLLSGTTCINSIYFYDTSGSEAEALFALGLRGTLAHGIFDWTAEDGLRKTEKFVAQWHGKDQGRIRVATSPHAPYSCSPGLLKEIESLRQKLNANFGVPYRILNTIHVAEGRTEAQEIKTKYQVDVSKGVATYLAELGVLNEDTIAAHAIHLTDEDYLSFKKTRASIASCPISNLKVGMGIANLPRAMTEGITLSFGTDGPASNNSLDMFETSKMASLLQKGVTADTTLMNSHQTFEIATLGGARSLHQEDQIGSLRVGKKADIVLLDVSNVRASPLYDPYGHIVFSAKSGDVRDVVIDGRLIVHNRELPAVDIEKLKELVAARVSELGFSAKIG